MRPRWCAAALLLLALRPPPPAACPSPPAPAPPASPPPPAPAPCLANPLCVCRADHVSCSNVPFHRLPETDPSARHVSVWAARLGALEEAALDARALRTLVLAASRLHHLPPAAFASMTSTLASLDLSYNEFTEVPLAALRDLKALNWLNLQNNQIAELSPEAEWGALAESLTSLTLSNNQLVALRAGALSALRSLAQLDLDGNGLRALAPGALPASLALLRLADNMLPAAPCAALALPRLRRLHLRNNALRAAPACRADRSRIDYLDLSQNELVDGLELGLGGELRPAHLVLDMNELTAVPALALAGGRLRRLSMSHNRLSSVPEAAVRALRRELERLELDRNELAALPAAVGRLARLRHLSLAYNRLREAAHLPPRLRYLSLAGNLLAELPAGLAALAPGSLAHLELGYNRIARLQADAFGGWAGALVTLGLRGNRIAQLAADAFPPALPLRELELGFNELYQVEGAALANLTSLRALELSSALLSGEFPLAAPNDALSWLTLDSNNIHYVSAEDLQNFPSLEYLNLEFNKIVVFPSAVNYANCSYKLRELRLAYNYVSEINGEFLSELAALQSVDLSYNRLRNVSGTSFARLPDLVYLSLAGNFIEYIIDGAFRDLQRLEILDLQENNLIEFSTGYLANVSNEENNFVVNVSRNRVSSLVGGPPAFINVLDLSHNLLEILSRSFFDSLGSSIRQLLLAHNRVTHIDGLASGGLPNLQVLNLQHNNISAVKRRAFSDTPALQMLDLSHNRLAQLSGEQFHALRRLRHLRLAANELRAVPRDALRYTVLEHLDLAANRLAAFPGAALAAVGFTLRRLELAHNRLEHLDAAALHATPFLLELGLAHNALTVLPDNALAGLARLRDLHLSHNALDANYRELLHYVPRLRRLALAATGLRAAPPLPLPDLTDLDLSLNLIAALREPDLRGPLGLRALDLAGNRLTSLQPAMWAALPLLTRLDVSRNPIVRVTRGAFEGLARLRRLRMQHLRRLEAVEPRAFRPLAALRSLALESPAGRGATLAAVAAEAPGLEALAVLVREETLDEQLAGVRAPRLRALDISGAALRRVTARAFASLGAQRALALRLTHTRVAALPAGLARPLARVPHLALDLSDNALVALDPAVLYPNLTGWSRLATKLLPGGLVVERNPLRCGCSAAWLGAWQRRWAREAGRGAAAALAAARRSTCEGRALLSVAPDAAECRASALSSRGSGRRGGGGGGGGGGALAALGAALALALGRR